jgi:RimK family alpha-L-glutamate ligase
MRGWLCYDKEGAERNEWFIARLIEKAKNQGLDLSLQIIENTDFAFIDLPDFAIVRFICPKLNGWLQARGVRVFNNAKTADIACDKWHTYAFLLNHGMPVLETELALAHDLPYPFVAKTRDGHGGKEVFWIENERDFEAVCSRFDAGKLIVQRPASVLGKDMRVYAIGGEIIAGVLRTSQADFRSNFSLGGGIELAEVDEKQREIVAKIHEKTGFDFIGVDFFPTEEGWVVNELEDSAGARMLYALSDIDIAEEMIKRIVSKP